MSVSSRPGSAFLDKAEVQRLRRHLAATLSWLRQAQDVSGDDGVSAGYTLLKGWAPSFPETTGYIIPTLLSHSAYEGFCESSERALRMADWLLTLQGEDGAFPSGVIGDGGGPSVFNSGQILFGLIRAAQVSGNEHYLAAACRCADWLVSVQDRSGEWRTHDFLGKSHVYNTRTAWALLLLNEVVDTPRYELAASRNLSWALSQGSSDGFYQKAAFDPTLPGGRGTGRRLDALARALREKNRPSFYTKASLHAIAYTIQGILESAWLLNIPEAEECALAGASALAAHLASGRMAGFYGPGWRRETSSWCLPGVAQMAVVWLRLAEHGHIGYMEAADAAIRILQHVQVLHHHKRELRGAIAGSKPIYGLYLPFRFPNWAAKFTADAFMLRLALAEPRQTPIDIRAW
jgi:hypothetical protein